MTLTTIIIGIVLFLLGIIGHEFIHVIQLKLKGIESYWIEWFPVDNIPRVYFMYDPEEIELSPTMEIIPALYTGFMWLLAIAFVTT